MSVGNLEEIESLIEMLAAAKERTIKGNVTLVAGDMPVCLELNWIRQVIARKYPQPLTPYGSPFWCVARAMRVYNAKNL